MDDLSVYIPPDRRHAIARGEVLPDHTQGAALFADISGFTPLTEALTLTHGPRRSVEELTQYMNAVYETLIAEIDRFGGSVISFAGDGVTCWFDDARGNAPLRAVACALAMQSIMRKFAGFAQPNGSTTELSMKTTVASGAARRFVVGDPEIQWIDALAGDTLVRTATAEHVSKSGEIFIDVTTASTLGSQIQIGEWREEPHTRERFALLQALLTHVAISPWEELSPPLTIDQIRPWLLRTIHARHIAGQGEFLTELRPVVALFLRFDGIDYDRDDDAGIKLNTLICRVQQIVQQYEGALIDLNIGDKGSYLYAAFGAPLAHEDDARRGLHAALKMRELGRELNFIRSLQIGISQGTMRAGAYGSTTRRTYGVLGNDVNIAARLMMRAAPGEILVSGRVQIAAMDEFDLEPLPPIELKGKREPLLVFLVKGLSDRNMRSEERPHALPMIGRTKELTLITEKLSLTWQSKGQIIGITGEAGMGKSRLVAEVIRLAKRRGIRCYSGACQSYGTNTSYQVWNSIWRTFFDVDESAPLRRQLRNLEGEITDLAPERVQALPTLNALLQIQIPENDFTRTLEPQYRKSALEALLLDCVRAAAMEAKAEGKALLFVLEDLHWIDPVSHDLLDALAPTISELPILLVLAYRRFHLAQTESPLSRIEALPYFSPIALTELTAVEAEALIRSKLAQFAPERMEAIPHTLIDRITRQAEGNPFYVEEFLNYLRDRGLDPFDVSSLATLELPNSLHRLILSRIDQLAEHQALVLKVASIIGQIFKLSHLHGYYPDLGTLNIIKQNLDELQQLDLTLTQNSEPELAYLFKHVVTQEVAYESISYSTRAALHGQYARYLESQISANAISESAVLDTLAYQYGKSENADKKREYLRRAGDAAQAAFANSTALDYYGQLLPLITDPSERISVQLKMGAVLELTGRWLEAEAQYRMGLSVAEQTHDASAKAQCEQMLGTLFRQRGDYDLALQWLEKSEQGWIELDRRAGLTQVLIEKGNVFLRKSDYIAAARNLQMGLELARELNDKPGMALALQQLGVVSHQSDYAAARMLYEKSLELWRELGSKLGIATSLSGLAVIVLEQGDFALAQSLLEESLVMRRELGDKRGIAISLNNLGALVEDQGNYDQARKLYSESLALRRELGEKPGIATSLGNLGVVAFEQRDFATARAYYAESMALWREINDRRGIGYFALCEGLLAHAEGQLAQAQSLCKEGLEHFHATKEKHYIANGLAALSVVSCALADTTGNVSFAVRAVQLAGATDTLTALLKTHLDPQFRSAYESAVAKSRTILDSETFRTTWDAGKQMPLDEVIEFALST